MNILIVLTSHERLGNTDNKTGFWLEEFTTPYYIFKDAGAVITLASPRGGLPPLDPTSELPEYQSQSTKRFKDDLDSQSGLANTTPLKNIIVENYDAVFYPGGHGPLWDLAEDKSSINLIEQLYAAGKPVAAVCHGPCVFRHTKNSNGTRLVKDKMVTSFTNSEEAAVKLTDVVPYLVEDMLRDNGGKFSNADDFCEHCVVDGNLITGQNPASSTAVARAVLDQLK